MPSFEFFEKKFQNSVFDRITGYNRYFVGATLCGCPGRHIGLPLQDRMIHVNPVQTCRGIKAKI